MDTAAMLAWLKANWLPVALVAAALVGDLVSARAGDRQGWRKLVLTVLAVANVPGWIVRVVRHAWSPTEGAGGKGGASGRGAGLGLLVLLVLPVAAGCSATAWSEVLTKSAAYAHAGGKAASALAEPHYRTSCRTKAAACGERDRAARHAARQCQLQGIKLASKCGALLDLCPSFRTCQTRRTKTNNAIKSVHRAAALLLQAGTDLKSTSADWQGKE